MLFSRDPWRLVEPLTLLLIIVYGPPYWEVRVPVAALAVMGMGNPKLLTRQFFWVIMLAVVSVGVVSRFYLQDNHKVLLLYWVLALAILPHDDRAAIRYCSRYLLGLVFLFATFWKVTSTDFLSGDFFTYTLLTDPRFEWYATNIIGCDNGIRIANLDAIGRVRIGAQDWAYLEGGTSVRQFARGLAWITAGFEALLALVFLTPSSRLTRCRTLLLLGFVVTTYSIAPVLGFAWLLLIMFIGQSESIRARTWAVLVMSLTALFGAPWQSFISL